MNLLRSIRAWWSGNRELSEQVEREVNEAYDEWESKLMPLPIEEARRRAIALLGTSERFRVEEAPPTDDDLRKLASLAPLLREFLERFSRVDAIEDTQSLSRELEHWATPFLLLGYDQGNNQLLIKPGDEAIYASGEATEGPEPDRLCDSIYHYLLYLDRMNLAYRPTAT